MPLSVDEIIRMGKEKNIDMSKYEAKLREKYGQTGVPDEQETQTPDINALVQKALGPRNAGQSIANALSILGGGQGVQAGGNDYAKLYAQEAIKSQFEDPTVRQLREAEIASLNQPPPEGLLRIGKQLVPDPSYIKPEEQRKINEEALRQQREVSSMRDEAKNTLSVIGKVKEGSKFFGPFGDTSSKYAPSSFLGMGNYKDRAIWEANLKTLVSKKFLETITKLKDLSKTGATGLGPLTEKEGQRLLEASTALNANLPPEEAVSLLNDMESIQKKIIGQDVPTGNVNSGQSNDYKSKYGLE